MTAFGACKFSSKVTWSEDLRSIDFNYMIRLEIELKSDMMEK